MGSSRTFHESVLSSLSRRHGLPGWALAVETGGELRTITMVNAQETVASTGLDNSHDGLPMRAGPTRRTRPGPGSSAVESTLNNDSNVLDIIKRCNIAISTLRHSQTETRSSPSEISLGHSSLQDAAQVSNESVRSKARMKLNACVSGKHQSIFWLPSQAAWSFVCFLSP